MGGVFYISLRVAMRIPPLGFLAVIEFSVGFNQVSVIIAMSILWSVRNSSNSKYLLFTLVAFHKVKFSRLLWPFSCSFII